MVWNTLCAPSHLILPPAHWCALLSPIYGWGCRTSERGITLAQILSIGRSRERLQRVSDSKDYGPNHPIAYTVFLSFNLENQGKEKQKQCIFIIVYPKPSLVLVFSHLLQIAPSRPSPVTSLFFQLSLTSKASIRIANKLRPQLTMTFWGTL